MKNLIIVAVGILLAGCAVPSGGLVKGGGSTPPQPVGQSAPTGSQPAAPVAR